MKLKKIPSMHTILHHWLFWLILITGVGILVRLMPSLINAAWGVDFGIYYGLTNSFIVTQDFFTTYSGWGNSYQFFPVLYTITGGIHWISGIETVSLMPKVGAIFGGLTVPLLYFITNEIIKNKKIALLSAAFLSVATFHVYQTSHTAPMTIGHFFMMISLLFLFKSLSKKRFFIPLCFSSILLILSHHFTTYFYLISVTFILFANIFNQHQNEKNNTIAFIYLLGMATAAFAYWAFVATPVFYTFMPNKMMIQPIYLISVFYVFLCLGFLGLTYIKRRQRKQIPSAQKPSSIHYKNILTYLALLISASILAAFYGIPGMTVRLTPLAVALSIPMLLLVSFSVVGLKHVKNRSNGIMIIGWVCGILFSFTYSLINTGFFPDRHLEYLIVPLCIGAAVAIHIMYSETHAPNIKSFMQPFLQPSYRHHKKRIAIISIISLMFVANMMATYPSVEVLNIMDERVTSPCIHGIEWMQGNCSKGVVASDHRLSNLLWASGYNITFSETNTTWIAENYTTCLNELDALNISYIVIDDIMRENVVFIGNGISYYMTNESYNKFSNPPFQLLYRNASYNAEGMESHWIEIYSYQHQSVI